MRQNCSFHRQHVKRLRENAERRPSRGRKMDEGAGRNQRGFSLKIVKMKSGRRRSPLFKIGWAALLEILIAGCAASFALPFWGKLLLQLETMALAFTL